MGNFKVIDIVFAILIVLVFLRSRSRGFISEFFSWAAPVAAILAAVYLHPQGAGLIRSNFMPDMRYVPEVLAFIGVFFISLTVFRIVERLIGGAIRGLNLGGLDMILGAAFGIVKGLALTGLILFVLNIQPFIDVSNIIGGSFFAGILLPHISRIPSIIGG